MKVVLTFTVLFLTVFCQDSSVLDVKPTGPTPIFVKYAFQYPDENKCPPLTKHNPLAPITVTIPANGTAQNVLEASVNVNSAYRFTATYLGSTPGYFVDAINGTALCGSCFWAFFVQQPGRPPQISNLGISNYIIPTSGYAVIMRYQASEESIGIGTAETHTDSSVSTGLAGS